MAITATIIGGALAVGGGIRSANQAKKTKQAQEEKLGQLDIGQRPEAAEYQPVNFEEDQKLAIWQNWANKGYANDLTKWNNKAVTTNDLQRAQKLVPGYDQMMRTMGNNASSLLNGELPYDDVLGIVGDRANQVGSINIPGMAAPATMRDLGLKRLDAMNAGGGMMQQMVQTAQTISPIDRYMKPQDSYVSPLDRIRLSMEQNQLIQQSDQNKNNLEAGVSPTDYAKQVYGLGLAGQNVEPNYEQIIGAGVGSIAGGLGGMGGGAGGAGAGASTSAASWRTSANGSASRQQFRPSMYSIPA